jgi:hypothetical protein
VVLFSVLLSATPHDSLDADVREVALPPPGSAGWRQLTFPKVSRATVYTPVDLEGLHAVRAKSDCSASALYLPVPDVDLRATPRLAWRWTIAQGLAVRDERAKAGDDFAARVYLTFEPDPGLLSLVDWLRRRVAAAVYGHGLPGSAITYVWSSQLPAGSIWDSPYTRESKMVSLGRGPLPAWRREEVDVAADYRRLFGRTAPRFLGVAVMSDSDNTCQQASAYFADFRFLGW